MKPCTKDSAISWPLEEQSHTHSRTFLAFIIRLRSVIVCSALSEGHVTTKEKEANLKKKKRRGDKRRTSEADFSPWNHRLLILPAGIAEKLQVCRHCDEFILSVKEETDPVTDSTSVTVTFTGPSPSRTGENSVAAIMKGKTMTIYVMLPFESIDELMRRESGWLDTQDWCWSDIGPNFRIKHRKKNNYSPSDSVPNPKCST